MTKLLIGVAAGFLLMQGFLAAWRTANIGSEEFAMAAIQGILGVVLFALACGWRP